MSITEQEKVSLLREGFVRARINPEFVCNPRERQILAQAEADARLAYPDPVTYGPEVKAFGWMRRRRSDGRWEHKASMAGDVMLMGDRWLVTGGMDARGNVKQPEDGNVDRMALALASCVPVTDAEVEAAAACLWHVDRVAIRAALIAARAAMRPEGTR